MLTLVVALVDCIYHTEKFNRNHIFGKYLIPVRLIMSCSNDWGALKEVVVGRADNKPVHLHDEPATRKKLDVAFAKTENEDARVKDNLVDKNMKSWRQELLKKQTSIIHSPEKRHEKCLQQVDQFVTIFNCRH